jgi:hypothetical protein
LARLSPELFGEVSRTCKSRPILIAAAVNPKRLAAALAGFLTCLLTDMNAAWIIALADLAHRGSG